MSLHQRTLRALNRLSGIVFVLALIVYAWPLRVAMPGGVLTKFSYSLDAPASRTDTADAADVVNANILSSSRRAPVKRYVSPDVAAREPFMIPPAFAPSNGTATSDTTSASGNESAEDGVPALYGIVSMDGRTRALLRLSTADASPALFGEGDKRGIYRVVSIRGNAVVLSTPSGTRTLRLARPARGDSSRINP